MLRVGLALKGYGIEAATGDIGTLSDLLFDETTWKVRWVVVDTGSWLCGRKILVDPTAIETMDCERQLVLLSLKKQQLNDTPEIVLDEPVSDPRSRTARFERADIVHAAAVHRSPDPGALPPEPDLHLRSMDAVMGHQCHTRDSPIGHLEDLLIDDVAWDVRYLIVNARTWWPGKHVLLSSCAVKQIGLSDSQIQIDVSRDQVKASPPWNPWAVIDKGYQYQLHRHYGWPFRAS